jgi:hypothetical protein
MRGYERRSGPAARRVHRDDGRAIRARLLRVRRDASRGARELLAFGRPEVETARPSPDGPAEGTDRLGRVQRQERGSVQRSAGGSQGGRRDHRVRLELPHGVGQLRRVLRHANDPGPASAVEELHDLFRDIRSLEGDHDPGDLDHLHSTSMGKCR